MKRLIFFFLILGSIAASSYLLLFSDSKALFELLKLAFEGIKAGTWKWSNLNFLTVFTYALTIFLFINAVLLISLLVMAFTTLFRFERVYRFYATATWYLIGAAIFTAGVVYMMLKSGVPVGEYLKSMPWYYYTPLGSAVVLFVLALIFKRDRADV